MTAKEMFEELGFTFRTGLIGYILYEDKKIGTYICFCEHDRKYFSKVIGTDTKLHQAITKQMKELGWIE